MIYIAPGASFEATLTGAPTGLTGVLGVRILDNAGGTSLARLTAGIVEFPAGSGFYSVTLTAPAAKGQFSIFWDNGSVSPSTTASEELIVTYNAPTPVETPAGGRPYSYAAVSDVESLLPGFVVSATSRPNASQVANILVLASNELDSLLSLSDYAVPIPTAASVGLEMVRSWTTIGAAYKTAMAMPQGKESKHADIYGGEWRAILEGVGAGQRYLPDAARMGTKMPRHAEPNSARADNGPVFTRAESQTLR